MDTVLGELGVNARRSVGAALTKTNKLKVNQVVIKVVDPEQYTKNHRVKVVGRGTAGQY